MPCFDTLWDRRTTVIVESTTIPTLHRYDALAHSASHAAKDNWRWLRGLVDVHRLACLPGTWAQVPRPLRRDQLLTVGLAVDLLGIPDPAPPVVRESAVATAPILSTAKENQTARANPSAESLAAVAAQVRQAVARLLRAESSPCDVARFLALVCLPPRITAHETSPHALVAVPRLAAVRTKDLARSVRRDLRHAPRLRRPLADRLG